MDLQIFCFGQIFAEHLQTGFSEAHNFFCNGSHIPNNAVLKFTTVFYLLSPNLAKLPEFLMRTKRFHCRIMASSFDKKLETES